MTWPFENDTSSIIKKIAVKNLQSDKNRNILLTITIAFATCLITATALYFFGSQSSALNKAADIYQATIADIDEQDIDLLQKDESLQVGISYLVGTVSYEDFKLTVRTLDENLIQLADYPEIQGKLPQSVDEVAVTQAFLSRAGLDWNIGDNISLDLGNGEMRFKVCGILPVADSNYSFYVSDEYVKTLESRPLCTAYIRLINSEGWSEAAIQNELFSLADRLGLQHEQVEISTYFASLIEQRSSQYILVIITISLIVALACALVIYSLFFVSIIRKTNEYGKLRTIGATEKQIKKIVFKEGYKLSKTAIPIGIVGGALAGYLLVPDGWNIVTVLCIAVITSLLMFICVMLTMVKPAKIASRITPIEAIRFASTDSVSKTLSTNRFHRRISAKRLAILNFSRDKKKMFLTIFSLGLCGTLFMASSAYFNSIDPENMARKSFPYGEVKIELGDYGPQSHNSEQYYELQKENLLTNELADKIKQLNGVEKVQEYYGSVFNVTIPTGDQDPVVSDAFTVDNQELLTNYLIEGTADYQELVQNNGVLIADTEQWNDTFGWEVKIGDEITLEAGTGYSIKVKVLGIVDGNIPYSGYNTLFIPLEMLKSLVPLDNLVYQFIVDTDNNRWETVREEIQSLVPSMSHTYITTFNDWVQAYQDSLTNYRMPVYAFIVFIGVFGIINLLNTLITNMLTRKRELGILQAVGLSKKQLARMLWTEGLLYSAGTMIISIVLGTIAGILLCQVFSAMSIFGVVTYRFPLLEMTGFLALILTVQTLFSLFAVKQFQHYSLVEQIRET